MRVVASAFGVLLAVTAALLGAAAAAVAAAVIAVTIVGWDAARPWLADAASAAVDRQVSIGHLAVDVSWRPEVTVRDLSVGNPPWAAEKHLLQLADGRLVYRLRPLLFGRLEIDDLALQRLELHLEQRGERKSWQLGPTGESAAPEERGSFPVIRRLRIDDGRLSYRGDGVDAPIDLRIAHLEGRSDGLDAPVSLQARGDYVDRPFDVELRLGPFAQLRDETAPYPVGLELHVGDTDAMYDGTITAPLALKGLDGEMELRGRTLDELHELLDLPVPKSPPYRLSGHLTKQDRTWRLQDFDGKLGKTDMRGDIAIDIAPTPPKLTARLTSETVDLSDLEGLTGRAPEDTAFEQGSGGTPSGGNRYLIPDEPFGLDKLHAMTVDLTFDGRSIRSGGQALDDLKVSLRLQDGRLQLEPIEFGIYDGTVAGDFVIDATRQPPSLQGSIRLREMHLSKLLEANDITDLSRGTIRGRASLSSRGTTLHELAAHADGKGSVVMQGGRISNLVIEIMALDLQEALGQYFADSRRTVHIGCLLAPFRVKQGRILADPWLVNTSDTLFTATGEIDLGRERVEMRILPQPKDFSFFNAETAITVTGDLAERTAEVNELAVAAKLALKTMLAPLMPLLSPEMTEEAQREGDCARLLDRMMDGNPADGG